MEFKGVVEAVTKVDNHDGMALRITIAGGVYIEISSIQDRDRFERLCKMVDLKKHLSISIVGESVLQGYMEQKSLSIIGKDHIH